MAITKVENVKELFFLFSFCLHLQHKEVPGPGNEPTPLHQPEYSSQILNPLPQQELWKDIFFIDKWRTIILIGPMAIH